MVMQGFGREASQLF